MKSGPKAAPMKLPPIPAIRPLPAWRPHGPKRQRAVRVVSLGLTIRRPHCVTSLTMGFAAGIAFTNPMPQRPVLRPV